MLGLILYVLIDAPGTAGDRPFGTSNLEDRKVFNASGYLVRLFRCFSYSALSLLSIFVILGMLGFFSLAIQMAGLLMEISFILSILSRFLRGGRAGGFSCECHAGVFSALSWLNSAS